MAKKTTTTKKAATTKKATTKTTTTPKVEKTATAKAEKTDSKKPKRPGFLLNSPGDYSIATPDYGYLIEHHNELFGTHHNKWRVRPAVFMDIHKSVMSYYKPPKNK